MQRSVRITIWSFALALTCGVVLFFGGSTKLTANAEENYEFSKTLTLDNYTITVSASGTAFLEDTQFQISHIDESTQNTIDEKVEEIKANYNDENFVLTDTISFKLDAYDAGHNEIDLDGENFEVNISADQINAAPLEAHIYSISKDFEQGQISLDTGNSSYEGYNYFSWNREGSTYYKVEIGYQKQSFDIINSRKISLKNFLI